MSANRHTIPPRITTHALGGLGRDLISTRWSFLSLDTSAKVNSNDLLASSTASSAVRANS
jgi:hypothetical protein